MVTKVHIWENVAELDTIRIFDKTSVILCMRKHMSLLKSRVYRQEIFLMIKIVTFLQHWDNIVIIKRYSNNITVCRAIFFFF